MVDYPIVILFMCLSLVTLSILVHENGRLSREIKRKLYLTYGVIILSSLTEMFCVLLNGAPEWTRSLHATLKCLDYIVTPCVSYGFMSQLATEKRKPGFFEGLLIVNAVIQAISLFTGWTYYVDEANFYHHGPYHFLYIILYIAAVLLVIAKFYEYGKRFPRGNQVSLIAILSLVMLGIVLQETHSADMRTACMALTLGTILLFIHFNEFSQQQNDTSMARQHRLLETDPLTGLFSRYAYNEALTFYSEQPIDPDTVIFSIDANGLKQANDTKGHLAGDELIRGAAQCIDRALTPYGKCYRTGGDEFVAIVKFRDGDLARALDALQAQTQSWKGVMVTEMSLAVGYAIAREHPELTIEKLFGHADRAMYDSKAQYYREAGKDRRRR